MFALCKDEEEERVERFGGKVGNGERERKALIDCGFTAHPSMVNVPSDPEKVEIPISVAVGNEDMAMKPELIRKMEEILMGKKGVENEVVIMKGAKHGFAVRQDKGDEYQVECADKAEKQAIEWFWKWFA